MRHQKCIIGTATLEECDIGRVQHWKSATLEESEIRNTRSRLRNREYKIGNARLGMQDRECEIGDAKSEMRNRGCEIGNARSGIRDRECEVGNSECEVGNPESGSSTGVEYKQTLNQIDIEMPTWAMKEYGVECFTLNMDFLLIDRGPYNFLYATTRQLLVSQNNMRACYDLMGRDVI